VSRSGPQDILGAPRSVFRKEIGDKFDRQALIESETVNLPVRKRTITEKTVYNEDK
jgi:hypothetical protein